MFIKTAFMNRIFLTFFALCMFSDTVSAQIQRTYHWYFGNGAGIDFSSGTAVAVTDGNFYAEEGCSAISDNDGNLLFYTNGDSVMNKNHQRMPNGFDLMGCWSSTQTVLIVPLPNNEYLYYIFTVDGWDGSGGVECNDYQNGFRYSVVDMSLEGGLGDVTLKNQLIHAPSTEQLAATFHANCTDIWLMTHDLTETKFYAYLVTSEGIDMNPVVSNIGDPNIPLFNGWYNGAAGCFKFSPNGRKFCAVRFFGDTGFPNNFNTLEIYDFDNNTGLLSNIIGLSKSLNIYGASFSPDNSKLFISIPKQYIYQYDLSSDDSATIVNSLTLIATSNDDDTTGTTWYCAMQIGADRRIYVARWRDNLPADTIPIINNPNEAGINCSFVYKGIGLSGKESKEGFPNFIETFFDTNNDCFQPRDTIKQEMLYIPSIFSPNNDGVNDILYVRGIGINQIQFAIYNRWGELIFESNDINFGWDGTYKGIQLQSAVFVFHIYVVFENGKQMIKSGNVTLLR